MSGKTRNILYTIFMVFFTVAAVAGTAVFAYLAVRSNELVTAAAVIACFVLCLFLMPLHTVLHELGHVLGGLLTGMRVLSLTVGYFCFDWRNKFTFGVRHNAAANGATSLLPRREKGARGKLAFALYAGAALDLLYAAVFFTLYFAVSSHPAVLFFTMFAPLAVYEGAMALYPIEMPAGPTDGKFAGGLLRRRAEEEVALRVMTAQGLLYEKTYAELPRELLFGAPVVREDCTAFAALLQLQWRYLFSVGDADATAPLFRLETLTDYLTAEDRREVAAELSYAYRVLCGAPEKAAPYDALVAGESAAALRAYAAMEPTETRIGRARRAAEGERMKGEREFGLALLSELK